MANLDYLPFDPVTLEPHEKRWWSRTVDEALMDCRPILVTEPPAMSVLCIGVKVGDHHHLPLEAISVADLREVFRMHPLNVPAGEIAFRFINMTAVPVKLHLTLVGERKP